MTYGALHGVRVVDLGIVTAGASTSAILADLGAEVIKVEGPSYTDPFREWTGVDRSREWWNESAQFCATNRNKRSVCLDLKSASGRSLLLRLVARSDVVVENFRYGVLDRLGLGFDALRAANPRIILASISSQGQTGPERDKSSFGSTLEASSGMAAMMRYPGERPQITGRGMNYPDQVAALFSASAVIAALIERRRSARAIALDLSQRELTAFLIGEEFVRASAQAAAPQDRDDATVEGAFPAADGQWVAVTVPAAACDTRRDPLGSAEALRRWILARSASEAAAQLRQWGAAAEVAWSAQGFDDPQALPTGTAFTADTRGRQAKGLPLRMERRDIGAFRAAPDLGEDNRDVAVTLMQLRHDEYDRYEAKGLFGTRPSKAAAGV